MVDTKEILVPIGTSSPVVWISQAREPKDGKPQDGFVITHVDAGGLTDDKVAVGDMLNYVNGEQLTAGMTTEAVGALITQTSSPEFRLLRDPEVRAGSTKNRK